MVEEALSFLRINAFYVSFDVSNVYVLFAFCASKTFDVRHQFDEVSHSFQLQRVLVFYRIKEFDPLPMSPSLLDRVI